MSNSYNADIQGTLITRFISGELTPEEQIRLDQWLAAAPGNRQKFEELTNAELLFKKLDVLEKVNEKEQQVWEKIEQALKRGKLFSLNSLSWIKFAAAVLVVGALAIFWIVNNHSKKEIAKTTINPVPSKTDIAPGGNKAVLILGDNQRIDLTNASNGNLAQQGNTKVVKTADGELRYQASGSKSKVYYNTVITPQGGQYQLTLPDGSKVWMNAASSLRFPTAFVGHNRVVELLTGEAYFEVIRNKAMPFIVKLKDDVKVQVLGTHFNVNNYRDEGRAMVTLLEGSVKVSIHEKAVMIKPGEQASIQQIQNDIIINNQVDLEKVMAWKNGNFYFDGESLEGIMKHLERWYDVEVEYERSIPVSQFGGIISRKKNLSEVLKALELSDVHFRIEGRKIKVIK